MLMRAMFIILLLNAMVQAQQPTLTFRGCFDLPDKGVEGLSGITFAGGSTYWAVMDNSDRIVRMDVALGDDVQIQSAKVLQILKLLQRKDFEGIAFTDPKRNSVFLSDESPGVSEYRLSDGKTIRSLDVPKVFHQIVANQGFESLAISADGKSLWTANERALLIDGNLKMPAEPILATTRVRLLRYDMTVDPPKAMEQFEYQTSGVHGLGGQIGLCDLAALPDGRLLALERSGAQNLSRVSSIRTRIFLVDPTGATDISKPPFDAGLINQTPVPVKKTLLYDGFVCDENGENLEGLCLGPSLGADRYAVLGVVDNTDGPLHVSSSRVVAFELNLHPPATQPTSRPTSGESK